METKQRLFGIGSLGGIVSVRTLKPQTPKLQSISCSRKPTTQKSKSPEIQHVGFVLRRWSSFTRTVGSLDPDLRRLFASELAQLCLLCISICKHVCVSWIYS